MKIATLQFAPSLGQVEENIRRADAILVAEQISGVDWLVLPEMAFSGYNFPSLAAITPYLEPSAAGRSSRWARNVAANLRCHVTVGYPELDSTVSPPARYNSLVTLSPDGAVRAHYRKAFLYYTDETWAAEGDRKFFHEQLGPPFGPVSMGICMDINPYRFVSPWEAYEFAKAVVAARSSLVVLSMAWLTRLSPAEIAEEPEEPDIETLSYWIERFYPLKKRDDAERPIVLVMANRCGQEGDVCYAGTSTVMRIEDGIVRVYGILGKGTEGCLVADLDSVSWIGNSIEGC